MGADKGYVAFGSQSYVAGAQIGNGIGNLVRENQAYNACMEASGFVPAEQQTTMSSAPQNGGSCGGGPGMPTTCH